jgi:S1-C subfamily serine protease
MKPHLLAALALALPAAAPAASGPLKEQALAIATANKDAVVFLSAVVSIEVTAGSMPAQKEERKVEVLGTVIRKDGLIVAPLSSLDVASAIDGRTISRPQGSVKLSAKSETKEVKIIMPDGSEVPAKVVLKDSDLDLAFLKPEKEGAAFTAVDTANSAPPALLDDVIVLGRLGKDLNRESLVATSEIVSIIAKPRVFAKTAAQCLGMPVFNGEGKLVGFGVNRFSSKSDTEGQASAANVLLPVADLLESASQVK